MPIKKLLWEEVNIRAKRKYVNHWQPDFEYLNKLITREEVKEATEFYLKNGGVITVITAEDIAQAEPNKISVWDHEGESDWHVGAPAKSFNFNQHTA